MIALAIVGGLSIAFVIFLPWPISGCLFDWLQSRRRA
jgi:hypothetical protein